MPLDSGFSAVVDMTNVKDSSGINPIHQEPGDYRGIIKDVSNGKSKQNDNVTITYLVADAERPSATYTYICTITEKSLWKLRNILVAAGVNLPKKKFKLTGTILEKIIGAEIGMSLDDNEYEGKLRSQIVGVFPAADLPEDDEVEEAPAKKKPAETKKKAKPAEDDEDEDDDDLDELDIDDL